jgi:hypothetical protein
VSFGCPPADSPIGRDRPVLADVATQLLLAAFPVREDLRGRAEELSVVALAGLHAASAAVVVPEPIPRQGHARRAGRLRIVLGQTRPEDAAGTFDDPYFASGLVFGDCYPVLMR